MLPLVVLLIQVTPRHDFMHRICTDAQFVFVDDDIVKKEIHNKRGKVICSRLAMKVMLPTLATYIM